MDTGPATHPGATAGCKDVLDDYTWSYLPPLSSAYTSVFLSNPFLQFLDVSDTGLTCSGLFYLLFEIANCDPLLEPPGLKFLKQLRFGPPSDHVPGLIASPWLPTISDALAEVHANCHALELCSLRSAEHAGDGNPPDAAVDAICEHWKALAATNSCSQTEAHGRRERVLRTR
jgi:hypothetical protein